MYRRGGRRASKLIVQNNQSKRSDQAQVKRWKRSGELGKGNKREKADCGGGKGRDLVIDLGGGGEMQITTQGMPGGLVKG